MNLCRAFVFPALIISLTISLSAFDINDGNIRLRTDDKTGSYSLFFLTDPEKNQYEPLFYSHEPKASYLSVNVNGNIHQLGKSKDFNTVVGTYNEKPAVIYQSSFLTVNETFTPVRTFSFSASNGVKIDIVLTNTGTEDIYAGLRMLIDTNLGEGKNNIPFVTNSQYITDELLIEGSSGELYWISRSQRLSLMGTIVYPLDTNTKTADYVHFANWKRLNKAQWKLDYVQGRSFNYNPYYTSDSAVCYYYEPDILVAGGSVTFSVFLTTEDTTWYNIGSAYDFESYQPSIQPITVAITGFDEKTQTLEIYSDPDHQLLLRMQDVLGKFLAGEIIINEHDLDDIEENINRLNAKFR
jgi:hypothetical protein